MRRNDVAVTGTPRRDVPSIPSPLGIVTGLAREAVLAGTAKGTRVRCAGARSARAARQARELAASGCAALLSFGLAGGLDPALTPGAIVIAESVVLPDGRRVKTHGPWARGLHAALGGAPAVRLAATAASDRLVSEVSAKAGLFERTGAACVDMETGAVAAAAEEADLPWLALRAVADPADRALPPWLPETIGGEGRPRLPSLLASLVRDPRAVPALLRIADDSRRGFAALRRVAVLAPPRFGLGAG